jgi:hypothetical protein
MLIKGVRMAMRKARIPLTVVLETFGMFIVGITYLLEAAGLLRVRGLLEEPVEESSVRDRCREPCLGGAASTTPCLP